MSRQSAMLASTIGTTTASGTAQGAGDHIGIVTASNGTTFTVTEGNMSDDIVGTRTMKVKPGIFRGFICPDFAAIAAESPGKDEREEIKV